MPGNVYQTPNTYYSHQQGLHTQHHPSQSVDSVPQQLGSVSAQQGYDDFSHNQQPRAEGYTNQSLYPHQHPGRSTSFAESPQLPRAMPQYHDQDQDQSQNPDLNMGHDQEHSTLPVDASSQPPNNPSNNLRTYDIDQRKDETAGEHMGRLSDMLYPLRVGILPDISLSATTSKKARRSMSNLVAAVLADRFEETTIAQSGQIFAIYHPEQTGPKPPPKGTVPWTWGYQPLGPGGTWPSGLKPVKMPGTMPSSGMTNDLYDQAMEIEGRDGLHRDQRSALRLQLFKDADDAYYQQQNSG